MLDFDGMLVHVGEFGLYQKILFLFQAPFCIFSAWVSFGQLFMLLYPRSYWCEQHFACLNPNDSIPGPQRMNISFRWNDGGIFRSDRCEVNSGERLDDNFLQWISDYDDRVCSRNRSELCFVNPRNFTASMSEFGSDAARKPYSTTPTPWEKPTTTPTSWEKPTTTPTPWEKRTTTPWGDSKPWPTYTPSPGKRHGWLVNMWNFTGYGSEVESGAATKPQTTTTSAPWRKSTTTATSYTWENSKPWPIQDLGYAYRNKRQATNAISKDEASSSTTTFKTTLEPEDESKHENKSVRMRTPPNVGNAWAGWPEPECPKGREKSDERIFIGTNTIIEAERMHGFFQNRSDINEVVYGRIPTDCRVTWNRSELPYETVVTEGEWWCWAEAYTTFAQAVFFVGAIVGGFLIGWVADTYGRVPALVLVNVIGALGGALSASTTNVWLFSVFRFFNGFAADNCYTVMYILALEFCGPKYRTLVANLSIAIFDTIGNILLPILARTLNNWRAFALVISLPMLLSVLAPFFVPESARWLLSKGRTAQATKILRNFAKVNGKKVDEQIFITFEEDAKKLAKEWENEEDPGLLAALKTPRLRRTFMLLIIFWSLIALVYEGHNRNIMNLANEDLDEFWLYGISSSTEFPADMLLIFTMDIVGRRWLGFGSMALSGLFSCISAVITPENRTAFLVTAIISRFWVNVAYNIGLQFAAELVPTVIRAQGVNLIQNMGYVTAMVSPFVGAIGRSNPTFSLLLLGIFAIIAGIDALFLSETLGEELPNTLEEAENFGKNQSFWNCPMCASRPDEDTESAQITVDEPPAPAVMRSALRGAISGATYRSSMLSQASSGGSNRNGRGVRHSPHPNELTRLHRRITN